MKKQLIVLLAILLLMGTSKAQTVSYETVTVALTSINTALTAMNASGITPAWQTQYTSGLAILTGAGQLAYGIYEAGASISTWDVVNISAGAATIITNSILLYQTFHSGKKTTWNIYFSPVKKNNPDYGFRLVKYFKI